ncbi:MAG TPA: Crp/Fnr family transcriptional regulator [Epsilonproteobacteria bacterium]|nr:Crp/Fnr family transcriptional regulator [Campylobacterota bacterium]
MFELKDIPLFSALKEEQLELLQSQMLVHQYTKDSVVFYEGEKSEYLQILLNGAVRLYKTNPKGTQVHMHNFVAPEIIALFAAFEHVAFPATCEFLTDGAVGLLPLEKIYECLHDVDFSMSLITALSKRMKLIADLFHKETIYSSEAKIADVLYHNPTVFERLKNGEIASILNITPETLSRTLTKFKKENVIAIDHHIVTILDKDALEGIIDNNILSHQLN